MKTIGKGFLFGLGFIIAKDVWKGLNVSIDRSFSDNFEWYRDAKRRVHGKTEQSENDKIILGFRG